MPSCLLWFEYEMCPTGLLLYALSQVGGAVLVPSGNFRFRAYLEEVGHRSILRAYILSWVPLFCITQIPKVVEPKTIDQHL
jgi:hypothetical protein